MPSRPNEREAWQSMRVHDVRSAAQIARIDRRIERLRERINARRVRLNQIRLDAYNAILELGGLTDAD